MVSTWLLSALVACGMYTSASASPPPLPPNTRRAPSAIDFGNLTRPTNTRLPQGQHPLHNDVPTYNFWDRQDHQQQQRQQQQGTMRVAQGATASCPVYADQTITIPVFFVVHYYSNPQGSKMRNHGYLSDWDINQVMRQLNADYAQYTPRVKFELSKETGKRAGVQYVLFDRIAAWNDFIIAPPSTADEFAVIQNISNTARGPVSSRPKTQMQELWIYTVKGITDGTIAFSYVPSSSTPFDVDGVWYSQDYINRAKSDIARYYPHALTHEVGHYLSLYHTFQGGCSAPNTASGGDMVTDTPPWADVSDSRTKSCVAYSAYGYKYNEITNPCGGTKTQAINSIKNFMSYSFAECMTVFTTGQRKRIWDAATKYRGFVPKCGKVV